MIRVKKAATMPPGYLDTKSLQAEIDNRGHSAAKYGILANLGDMSQKFQDAISQIPAGETLLLPSGVINITSVITVNRSIKIRGKKPRYLNGQLVDGTVVKGEGFRTSASDIEFYDIGVDNRLGPNGFFVWLSPKNVKFINCVAIAKDHGFIVESTVGTYKSLFEKCEAYDSIHGFVSKGEKTTFKDCWAENCTTNGFVFVSDNISGTALITRCIDNIADSCYAKNCATGFNVYSRDYFSENNANNILLTNLTLTNCYADSCSLPYRIGDDSAPPAGRTHNDVIKVEILGCYADRTTGTISLSMNRSDKCTVDDFNGDKDVIFSSLQKRNVRGKIIAPSGNWSSNGTITGVTPSIAGANGHSDYFITNNASQAIMTDILGGNEGDEITIYLNDANTILGSGVKIQMKSLQVKGTGSWIRFKKIGGTWVELFSRKASSGAFGRNLVADGSVLPIDSFSAIDVWGTGTTANVITVQSGMFNKRSEVLTICVRSTASTFTYGGYDPALFKIPTGFPTTLTFPDGHASQWMFHPGINKWVCVSDRMVTL